MICCPPSDTTATPTAPPGASDHGRSPPSRLPTRLVVFVLVLCAVPLIMLALGYDGRHGPDPLMTRIGDRPLPLSSHLQHAFLEWTGVSLAAFVALLAMLRYSLHRDATAAVMGIALLCTAAMDAFHVQASQSLMLDPARFELLGPYTWLLSRLVTGAMLGLGAGILLLRNPPFAEESPPSREPVLLTVSLLTLVTAVTVLLPGRLMAMGLPRTVFPDDALPRPAELIPAAVFLLSGWFVFRPLHRRTDSVFAHALLVSTWPQACAGVVMAVGSAREFDWAFDAAHGLKLVGYAVLLSGVLRDYVNAHCNQLRELAQRRVAEAEARAFAEAAERADRAKSTFLASMSHEIRTPLGGVLGMSEMLLDTRLETEQRHMAETIQLSSESLLALINDILDLSKVEAGQLDLEEVDLELRPLLDDVLAVFGQRANAKSLQLTAHLAEGTPRALVGDPARLRQVLLNLVGNAVKFTPAGSVAVRVAVEVDAPDGDGSTDGAERATLRVEVCDTGIGVKPDDAQRLFESFTQADRSTTREFGGTGLGLTICRRLVGLMGGEIGVRSDGVHGSTFWFTVRLGLADGHPARRRAPAAVRSAPVVVCAGEGALRDALCSQLEELGCTPRVLEPGDDVRDVAGAAVALLVEGADASALELAVPAPRRLLVSASAPRDGGADVDGWVQLPLRTGVLCDALDDLVSPAPAPPEPELPPRFLHARVLVADDNAVNRQVLRMMLERLGVEADFVHDGRACVERLSERPYDLVLMDCDMPVMNGIDATAAIRAREGDARHTPIIALTANALTGDRERCLAAGMDDYLSKPVLRGALTDRLAAHLVDAPSVAAAEG